MMDYKDEKLADKLSLVHDELIEALEKIFKNEYAEVCRVISLAEPSLWEYYELTGMEGQPEQRMLENARKQTRDSIKSAIKRLGEIQRARSKAAKSRSRRSDSDEESGDSSSAEQGT